VSVEPTGATITWTGNTIFRIACGRLTEQWSESDTLSVFEQLGVIEWPPADSMASPAAD
jgi:predicted ester cyclase